MFAVVISRTSQINPKSHHSRVMNKLFKHAFDPFHGKYFAVSFSRYSSRNSPLHKVPSPSPPHRATIEFLRARITWRSSHRRTILSEQVSIPQILSRQYEKILRCFPRRDHSRESFPVYVAPPVARIATIYNSEPTSAIKRGRKGVKLYCGRGVGSLFASLSKKTVITLS